MQCGCDRCLRPQQSLRYCRFAFLISKVYFVTVHVLAASWPSPVTLLSAAKLSIRNNKQTQRVVLATTLLHHIAMCLKLSPLALLLYYVILFTLLCGFVEGYAEPSSSDRQLQIYSNGTLSFDIVFNNWTGYWTTQTTCAAGSVVMSVSSL